MCAGCEAETGSSIVIETIVMSPLGVSVAVPD